MRSPFKLLCDVKNSKGKSCGVCFFSFLFLFFNLNLLSIWSNFPLLEDAKALSDSCRKDDVGSGMIEESHLN